MLIHKNVLFTALTASALLAGTFTANAANIRVACGTGPGLENCVKLAEVWAKENGHTIEGISTPQSATEQLALYQQILAAGSDDIDVFMIDVVWPGILAGQMVDLKPHAQGAEANHFSAIVENNTVDGKLVGMPFYTDAPVLYYRKDLLEKHGESVPETWDQLTATAEKIQKAERDAGNDKLWGFVWQGRAYEGLTCDGLEWVASHNGGTIVEQDGSVSINNPQAAAAIDKARGWVGTITPEGVLNYTEEEGRGVFQSGNAVFMRNWPYAWSLSQADGSAVQGKVGIAPLPKGGEDGKHAATLGGWQLAVSQYSKNQEAAIGLVLYMTSKEVQKQRAVNESLLPTISELYEDPDVLAANPFFAEMKEILSSAVARPSTVTGSKYNQVSSEFFNAVYAVISGGKSGEQAVADLESSLKRLSRRGW